MAALTTTNNTEFTPAKGDFRVQCTAGQVTLQSRAPDNPIWAEEFVLQATATRLVYQGVQGIVYRFTGAGTARADQ